MIDNNADIPYCKTKQIAKIMHIYITRRIIFSTLLGPLMCGDGRISTKFQVVLLFIFYFLFFYFYMFLKFFHEIFKKFFRFLVENLCLFFIFVIYYLQHVHAKFVLIRGIVAPTEYCSDKHKCNNRTQSNLPSDIFPPLFRILG